MSEQWQNVKLGTVLTPVARGEAVNAEKEYRLLGIRLDGQGPFHRETVMGAQTAASKLFCVAKGDFIYSRLFACRGAFGVISSELDGCFVSGEFPTFVPITGKVDVEFLKYWFRLPRVIARVDEDCSGSTPLTRNRFKEKFLLSLDVPLPSLVRQQQIVARIEGLAAQIKEAQMLRDLVTEEIQALIISNHIRLAGRRKRRIGEIIRLDEDVVTIQPGGSYPQVGIKSFGAGLFPKAAISGRETTYRTFNRLYDGAVVLSQVKGWEGAVAVCPESLAGWFVSPEYRTFRCVESESLPGYLAPLVRTEWFWSRLANATRGVGARRERTRPEQFLNVEIPMPDLPSQYIGTKVIAEIEALQRLQADTVIELDALLPSVLSKAFSGEL